MASHGSDDILSLGDGALHWLNGLDSHVDSGCLLLLLPPLPDESEKKKKANHTHSQKTVTLVFMDISH